MAKEDYAIGDRVKTHGRSTFNDLEGKIDSRRMTDGQSGYYYIRLDRDNLRLSAYTRHLKPVETATPASNGKVRVPSTTATHSVSAESAFKEGNEVQFTVAAADVGDNYVVGCKSIGKADLLPAIWRLEKQGDEGRSVNLTLRGVVRDGRITVKDQWVDRYDIESYGRDIRVISTEVEEKKPDVTITISQKAAEAFVALSGKVAGRDAGYRGEVEKAREIIAQALGVTGGDSWDKVPAWNTLTGQVMFND